MDLNSSISNVQKQTLTPRMIQELNILQFNEAELDAYIREVFEKNPLVEFRYSSSNSSEDYLDQIPDTRSDITRDYRSMIRMQLPETDNDLSIVLDTLIEHIDSHGRLDFDIEAHPEMRYDLYARAKHMIQSLEPAGIGAETLIECLLLQTARMQCDHTLADKIISNYLENVSLGQYNYIARHLHVNIAAVEAAVQQIQLLDPDPCREFRESNEASSAVPEISVTRGAADNEWRIKILSGNRKFRMIDPSEMTIRLKSNDKQTKTYLDKCRDEVTQIMDAVRHRDATILRCVAIIVEEQAAFFSTNSGNLIPLKLEQIADRTGLHLSTVSRALSGKYLRCGRGIFPLTYFLQRSISGDEKTSAENVKSLLRELIGSEDPEKPLSDENLREELKTRGYSLTRRTIANYRAAMNIPSTALRRRQKSA